MLLVREVPVETIFTRKQQADEREKMVVQDIARLLQESELQEWD
jgi:hypothetical protein